jgi:ketosteroid isomerase-like protein
MGELDEFQSFLARQEQAEAALLEGDAQPRLSLWSRRKPVSLLGAGLASTSGWDELERTFVGLAARLREREHADFRFDVEIAEVSVDGQMAYAVGFERFNEVLSNGALKPITVRVTHVYRREDGDWRIAHRHGSRPPISDPGGGRA